ncbi:MAG: hypothetical protein L0387_45950 [Acidobacteria bacterium]|nr:hypothetical protein [Acidobacteriota bacterium]
MNSLELARWALSIAVPALAGFFGVLVGAWLTSKREERQRRFAFLERQLRDFYSPLLGLRSEIRKKGELRVRISGAANTEWQRLCAQMRDTARAEENLERLQKEKGPQFDAIINYNNEQFAKDILPAYRRMLSVFRDNLWLAEAETRLYFERLLEFVDLWERWIAHSIPHEVVQNLGHSEESLHPFYDHLEKKHDELRQRLAQGRA